MIQTSWSMVLDGIWSDKPVLRTMREPGLCDLRSQLAEENDPKLKAVPYTDTIHLDRRAWSRRFGVVGRFSCSTVPWRARPRQQTSRGDHDDAVIEPAGLPNGGVFRPASGPVTPAAQFLGPVS